MLMACQSLTRVEDILKPTAFEEHLKASPQVGEKSPTCESDSPVLSWVWNEVSDTRTMTGVWSATRYLGNGVMQNTNIGGK